MASVNYMTQILFSMGMISNILNTAVRAIASSNRISEVLSEIPAQQEAKAPVTPAWQGAISFEDVLLYVCRCKQGITEPYQF